MELAQILREMWRRRLWLGVAVLVAAFTAITLNYRVSPWPPSISQDSIEFGAASTVMLVDSPRSPLADLAQVFDPLTARAGVYSRFMASPTVTAAIAEEAGLTPGAVVAEGPFNPKGQRSQREATQERRATQLVEELGSHQLRFESEEGLPTVRIFATGPTAKSAEDLANAVVPAFARFVRELEQRNAVPPAQRVVLRQLGEAQGALVNEGADKAAVLLTFLGVLVGGVLLVLVSSSVADGWRTLNRLDQTNGFHDVPLDVASALHPDETTRWPGSGPAARNGGAATAADEPERPTVADEPARNPDA